jgi:arginyl-tRNA synthetase
MLAKQGNTSTYLQYAYARIRSIFRKGGIDPEALRRDPPQVVLGNPAERALAVELMRFAEILDAAGGEYRPNLLTSHLFELAERFSTFYNACPVLKADDETSRRSRLQLCDLSVRVLAQGLDLLGIRVIEQM